MRTVSKLAYLLPVGLALVLSGCMVTGKDIPFLDNPQEQRLRAALAASEPGSSSEPIVKLRMTHGLRNQSLSSPLPSSAGPGTAGVEVITVGKYTIKPFIIDNVVEPGPLRFTRNDVLRVAVWGHEDLEHVTVIQPNGAITIPLVGEISAEGKSAAELRDDIMSRLAFYSDPGPRDLRHGDALTMVMWKHPDLTQTAEVDPEGRVTLPLIGTIDVIGRNINELQKIARKRARRHIRDAEVSLSPEFRNRRILYDPEVSVLAEKLKPRTVAVVGDVQVQGLQPIEGSLRVIEALAQAQYRQDSAELNSVIVIRDSNTRSPGYRRLKLADFIEGKAPGHNIFLKDGDVIIVPKSAIAQVGDFIEKFFARTKPVFDWWIAGQQARFAERVLGNSAQTSEDFLLVQ